MKHGTIRIAPGVLAALFFAAVDWTAKDPAQAAQEAAPGPKQAGGAAVPADPRLPTLFLIGDSTVRNGRGDGQNGKWGWGEPITAFFDASKINVVNRALGGRSSRTYLTQGRWNGVIAGLKGLKGNPLSAFLSVKAAAVSPYRYSN